MRIACAHYDNVAGETAVIVVTAATPFLEKAKSHRRAEVPDATHSDLGKMRKNAPDPTVTYCHPVSGMAQAPDSTTTAKDFVENRSLIPPTLPFLCLKLQS